MGILARLHRVTVGGIEAFLKRFEDPEVILPQLIREMEAQLRSATEAEASVAASVKRAERDLEQARQRVTTLGRGAELALSEGQEQTARDALSAQVDAERAAERAQQNLDRTRQTLERATDARMQVHQQLQDLRSRKDEILARARVAKAQKKVSQSVDGAVGSTDSILDAVARLEHGVAETESELEIRSEINGEPTASLEQRLIELERNSEVERRLAALRSPGPAEPTEPTQA